MIELTVASEIHATADEVWRALTDLPRFREWNPFIRAASGKPAVGARLRVRVRPGRLPIPLVFHPTVTVCDEARELRWRGCFLAPWLASGDHTFKLEPLGDGRTRLVQHETFGGLLTPLLAGLVLDTARRGFQAMNGALRTRVEGHGVA